MFRAEALGIQLQISGPRYELLPNFHRNQSEGDPLHPSGKTGNKTRGERQSPILNFGPGPISVVDVAIDDRSPIDNQSMNESKLRRALTKKNRRETTDLILSAVSWQDKTTVPGLDFRSRTSHTSDRIRRWGNKMRPRQESKMLPRV
jgi:hypothetical protein